MVVAPGTASHLDLDWELPGIARLLEALGRFSRLIRFDKRGTGLSDRPTDAATLEERTDDIRAVMDAAGSERAVIFGRSEGGSMACLFAATYPERTRSLILWGVQARWLQAEDYPWGSTPEQAEHSISLLEGEWPSVGYLLGPGAGLGRDIDPDFLDWWLRYARASASPSAIVALERMNLQIDIRDILPSVRVPTLVLNRTGDPVAHVGAARDLARGISGARFVEFAGETHSMIGPEHELARYSGEELDRAGDGLLALFDGPTRAIQCAREIQAAGRGLGLELRAGLHTGEVERSNGDVRGIAVHLAARIAALAEPGEVLVSSTVRDLVAGSGLTLEDRGEHTLKGIEERRRLFSVG